MREAFLFMMVSLDGYFEGLNADISWHNVDEEFNEFAIEQTNNVGTLLFGHKTYQLMANWWPTDHAKTDDPIVAKQMNEMPKLVASHESFVPEWENTSVITGDITTQVKELKTQPGKDVGIYGSNQLCVSLMQTGLVDEFRIMVNPVALGQGRSLFTGLDKSINLHLARTREFKSGNVLLVYRNKQRGGL